MKGNRQDVLPQNDQLVPDDTNIPQVKSSNPLFIILIILLLLTGGIGIYFLGVSKSHPSPSGSNATLNIKYTDINSDKIPTPPIPSLVVAQQWAVYKDPEYKFQIDYPVGWLFATPSTNEVLIKQDDTEKERVVVFSENDIDLTSTYQFGRIIISIYGTTNDTDIEKWFNKEFPEPEPGLPISGKEISSKDIDKVIISSGNIKILRLYPYFTNQMYYFLLNNKVVIVEVNYANDDNGLASKKNMLLQTIYEHMISSITISSNSAYQPKPNELYYRASEDYKFLSHDIIVTFPIGTMVNSNPTKIKDATFADADVTLNGTTYFLGNLEGWVGDLGPCEEIDKVCQSEKWSSLTLNSPVSDSPDHSFNLTIHSDINGKFWLVIGDLASTLGISQQLNSGLVLNNIFVYKEPINTNVKIGERYSFLGKFTDAEIQLWKNITEQLQMKLIKVK